MLTSGQLGAFIADGYVRIDGAFPADVAASARAEFWDDLRRQGILPDDPHTWTKPVVRLGMYTQQQVVAAASTPVLLAAFDQLAGPGAWRPCRAMGTVPVRFPSSEDSGDTGWHIDVSFGGDAADFLSWRANAHSRGRVLLMLFLFSDTTTQDAPTRILAGSHREVARVLAPAGDAGLSLRELMPHLAALPSRREVPATGPAGTVYLCHPFLVHAAQAHRGSQPRFMAQPPLLPVVDDWLPANNACAVAKAIAMDPDLPGR